MWWKKKKKKAPSVPPSMLHAIIWQSAYHEALERVIAGILPETTITSSYYGTLTIRRINPKGDATCSANSFSESLAKRPEKT